ncbi:MAG: biotin/lipoyl-binding protein [Thermoplasmata archaeon]|nr:biotin/lipoyl-binding protein [Thermoplasmata archaeon]
MKVEVTVDGERREVEVDLGRGVVRWNGRELPLKVVSESPLKVELEVAGERTVVEGWVTGVATPPAILVVGGENYAVQVKRHASSVSTSPPARARAATPGPPAPAVGPSTGSGIVPPMPGKVVELRVKNGDRVTKGQVLLVLEAMKMRNEVASPVAGTVADIRVAPGANVRAREMMLSVVPDA